MIERGVAERMIRELHGARVAGDLAAMCRLFAPRGADKPIAIASHDLASFRPWLSMLVKVFRVTHYESLSFVFEGNRAGIHWRGNIHSKITGVTLATELVDVVEFQDEHIVRYGEFFEPCEGLS
jgi:ketosteroid isomerase-like protein